MPICKIYNQDMKDKKDEDVKCKDIIGQVIEQSLESLESIDRRHMKKCKNCGEGVPFADNICMSCGEIPN